MHMVWDNRTFVCQAEIAGPLPPLPQSAPETCGLCFYAIVLRWNVRPIGNRRLNYYAKKQLDIALKCPENDGSAKYPL